MTLDWPSSQTRLLFIGIASCFRPVNDDSAFDARVLSFFTIIITIHPFPTTCRVGVSLRFSFKCSFPVRNLVNIAIGMSSVLTIESQTRLKHLSLGNILCNGTLCSLWIFLGNGRLLFVYSPTSRHSSDTSLRTTNLVIEIYSNFLFTKASYSTQRRIVRAQKQSARKRSFDNATNS